MELFKNFPNCIVITIVLTIITSVVVSTTCEVFNQTTVHKGALQENPDTSNKTYNCTGTVCDSFICTKKNYSGNSPPDWCINGNRTINMGCKVSETCWGDACEVVSSCSREYEYRGETFFDFKCFGKKCRVKECLNKNCKKAVSMKKEDFENRILKKLPSCSEVDGKKSRSKRTIVDVIVGLKDHYCCDITLKAEGVIFGVVRKERS